MFNTETVTADFKTDYDNAICKEFGPQGNSKCFTESKRTEYIEKLLQADINMELPKRLKGFSIGDVNTSWDRTEWRFKSKTVDKVHLWTQKIFSSSAKNLGINRRIIVLEEFFQLIKSYHEKPSKNGFNGQKRLFNSIKNRYACLPRDAVDKYITMWRRTTSRLLPTDIRIKNSSFLDNDGCKDKKQKNCVVKAETITIDSNIEKSRNIAGITISPSDIFMEVNQKKKNSTETANKSSTDHLDKFSGVSMVYQHQYSSELKTSNSLLLNIKYQIDNGENRLSSSMSGSNFCNSILQRELETSNQGSSKENSLFNDDVKPRKRRKLDEGDSESNTDNDETFEDNDFHIIGDTKLKVIGTKRPSDIDKAYNIFVRRLIDSTLNRTITFCEQPKHIIQNLETICINAFPTFDKMRHRIKFRGYLKACRRNSKKHNGKISMKDTPSHMCSENAYSIANKALLNADNEIKRLKLIVTEEGQVNRLSISKQTERQQPKSDTKYFDYANFNSFESPFPTIVNSMGSDNEQFSSMLNNFLPYLYGILSDEVLVPPIAHCNSLPNNLFSVMEGRSHYTSTTHLLDKILHTTSIDPDFGMDLILNRSASQEAISCMRLTARYLLSKSVIMESYLINESAKLSNIIPENNN